MGKKAVVTRTETVTDDEDEGIASEENENLLDVALFEDQGATGDKKVGRIEVTRMDPDEGYLGVVEPDATKLEIFNRWGGSKFLFTAKNERGRILTKRTDRIAGDPIFMSDVAEMKWRRANGLKPKPAEGAAANDGAYSAKELMAIIEAKADAARQEAETREEKRRREETEREEKRAKDEREWRAQQEKERAEREERVRRDDREHAARMDAQRREDDKRREDRIREDEARREKEHERQMAAAIQAAKESQEKNQQFFTNMLAMSKANDKVANADPMAQVTQILSIVEALKGTVNEGPKDAVTALLERLPETLQAAGGMVGDAIREAKGLPARASDGGEGEDESIKLTGEAAAKMRQLVGVLLERGVDPEKALVAIADSIITGKPITPAPARRPRPPRAHKAPEAEPASPTTGTAPAAKPAPAPVAKPPGAP